MTLEDFEKSLAEDIKEGEKDSPVSGHKTQHHHHHRHHHRRKHYRDGEEKEHGYKRSKRSERDDTGTARGSESRSLSRSNLAHRHVNGVQKRHSEEHRLGTSSRQPSREAEGLKRDLWMEASSALEFDYTQRGTKAPPQPPPPKSAKADFELKIHEKELNKHHLENLAQGQEIPSELVEKPAHHIVDYTFGDAGSQWRMRKLKNVLRSAEENGRALDDVAIEAYGNLRSFDDAREEQIELERRDTYGPGYVGKEMPSGELFQERKMQLGVRRKEFKNDPREHADDITPRPVHAPQPMTSTTGPMDHTALNRLKAQMMKARLRGSADASRLESEYEAAITSSTSTGQPESVVLGAMESRMLAASRKGEVKAIDNRRGRERGLVEENDDMSIEDMVREERRTRYQAGGESQRFAERIAKDGKFDVGLFFMNSRAS